MVGPYSQDSELGAWGGAWESPLLTSHQVILVHRPHSEQHHLHDQIFHFTNAESGVREANLPKGHPACQWQSWDQLSWHSVYTLFPLNQAYFKTTIIIIILLPIILFEYQVLFLFHLPLPLQAPFEVGDSGHNLQRKKRKFKQINNKNGLKITRWGVELDATQFRPTHHCFSSSSQKGSPLYKGLSAKFHIATLLAGRRAPED